MERPTGWESHITQYIAQIGQNSYYLGNLKDIMLFVYNYYEMTTTEQIQLKLMIQMRIVSTKSNMIAI